MKRKIFNKELSYYHDFFEKRGFKRDVDITHTWFQFIDGMFLIFYLEDELVNIIRLKIYLNSKDKSFFNGYPYFNNISYSVKENIVKIGFFNQEQFHFFFGKYLKSIIRNNKIENIKKI